VLWYRQQLARGLALDIEGFQRHLFRDVLVLVIIAHMDNKTFHHLVDEIDIRQHRKSVLAGQFQATEVRPAAEEFFERRSGDALLSRIQIL
jgi:hypothetical protein